MDLDYYQEYLKVLKNIKSRQTSNLEFYVALNKLVFNGSR